MSVRGFLGNNALMMMMAFILALLLGGFPEGSFWTNATIAMGTLMVMMSVSLTNLQLRGLKVRDHSRAIARAFILSFILSSGTTIAMSYLFQGDIRYGWIMEAAVPSAVSVIPFCYMLKGDLESTLVASAALYFIALIFTPLLTLVFIGQAVSVATLLWYVGLLILLPMVVSRPLRRVKMTAQTKGIIINIAFFVLILAVAGANRQVFFEEPMLLAALIAVAVVRTFGIGLVLEAYHRRKGVRRERRVPEVLFATHKNTGMAAALALALIGFQAAIPATVCMTVDIAWLIVLSRFVYPTKLVEGAVHPSQ